MIRHLLLVLLVALACAGETAGAQIAYRLPTDGPLPRTWRVTLAITDAKNPDWILSQFAAGVERTVTAENGGDFSETWDGLDDNFMPLPPGTYGVKGICMPAERWLDGQPHSVVPRFVGGVGDWLPHPDDAGRMGEPFHGDPCNSPIGDIAVSPEGVAVFYYQYLENGLNNPMIDLRRPQGPGQFLRAFPSGGAGGGNATCTDGETVWSYSGDGGHQVYRADGKAFGSSPRCSRKNGYQPDGLVTGMAAWRADGRTTVFIAQRGRLVQQEGYRYIEGPDPVDLVTVHAGDGGRILASLPLARPRALAARDGRLYGLHGTEDGWAVSVVALQDGVPAGSWTRILSLPTAMDPGGLAIDGAGRVYVSEPAANRVHQYAADGKRLRSYGRLATQLPGSYDRESLMHPLRLAAWRDGDGRDRLLVMEAHGPMRVSEWSADGALLREFASLQTSANGGWAVDPADPRQAFVIGKGGWMTRYAIDPASGRFTVAAVYPGIGTDPRLPCTDHLRLVRVQGRPYLASASRGQYAIYRLDGDRWLLAAGIVQVKQAKGPPLYLVWSDADGDGAVQDGECAPMQLPGRVLRYHGEQVGEDLALLALNQGGRDAWRLPIARFDARGTPVLGEWQRIITDPVFAARAEGRATALFGGNELTDTYNSDWGQVDGTPERGFWITARGGPSFSANQGAQEKVSCYVPDGAGGMRLRWRAGRATLRGLPQPGETVAAQHIHAPMGGLVAVIDQSRCGVLLYDQDGLYVDTLFPAGGTRLGMYSLGGEFFGGFLASDPRDGAIYIGMGKDTPTLYRCVGWTAQGNPSRPLPGLQQNVDLALAQIAKPPDEALAVRGGSGAARLARFAPAQGGVDHDGSLAGWEQCDPIVFSADKERTVEARCLWDPERLHVRIHARTGAVFAPRALAPIDRVFAHERASDAVSLYIQGDPTAPPATAADGRPGDVRVVLGLFDDAGSVRPAAIGFHRAWRGPGAASASYRTPVGSMSFAHVGELPGAVLGGRIDADGKGYVVSASIPRAALGLPQLSPALRTTVNLEATFGGHAKFWWSNRDGSASRETWDEPTEARLYPGSWSPAEFLPAGPIVLRNWLACGPFGGPGAEAFTWDPQGKMKDAVRAFYEKAAYPPETACDPAATYAGEQVSGWWNGPAQVRWRPVDVEDLDARVHLGKGGAQVWFLTSWIRAEAATDAMLTVHGMPQARIRLSLDDAVIYDREPQTPVAGRHAWLTADVPAALAPGWHRLQIRTYAWGYGAAKAGLAIAAPAQQLWGVRVASRPPP